MSGDKLRSECPSLPKGWIREVVLRKNGASAGKSDVYYYSPEGRKFRSKPQISQYFGETLDLAKFDFRSGRFDGNFKNKKRQRERTTELSFAKDFLRPSIVFPKRITKRSIERKMVKLVRNSMSDMTVLAANATGKSSSRTTRAHEKAEAEVELKRERVREASISKEDCKPRQLFWQKRLQGLNAVDSTTKKASKHMKMPTEIKNLAPAGDDNALLDSIMTCIQSNTRVIGQNMSLNALKKNPGIWCNPDQPFCPPFVITTEMIRDQEKRVEKARKNLADAVEVLRYIEDDDMDSD